MRSCRLNSLKKAITWIRNSFRFIIQPSLRFLCFEVFNLIGSIFIPIFRLAKSKFEFIYMIITIITFVASGSAILASSTQSSGLKSSGSSISFSGFTEGLKSSRRSPRLWLSPLNKTSYVLLGLPIYDLVSRGINENRGKLTKQRGCIS